MSATDKPRVHSQVEQLIAKLETLRSEAVAERFEIMVVLLDELIARLKKEA
ncbi:hypothetical protein [Bosea sp. UC22_33]|uniref:hypothetical protein n=1 Tax=Bosea sp. UC22_33 TaxID=3350165 RepID=UPI00366ACF46